MGSSKGGSSYAPAQQSGGGWQEGYQKWKSSGGPQQMRNRLLDFGDYEAGGRWRNGVSDDGSTGSSPGGSSAGSTSSRASSNEGSSYGGGYSDHGKLGATMADRAKSMGKYGFMGAMTPGTMLAGMAYGAYDAEKKAKERETEAQRYDPSKPTLTARRSKKKGPAYGSTLLSYSEEDDNDNDGNDGPGAGLGGPGSSGTGGDPGGGGFGHGY